MRRYAATAAVAGAVVLAGVLPLAAGNAGNSGPQRSPAEVTALDSTAADAVALAARQAASGLTSASAITSEEGTSAERPARPHRERFRLACHGLDGEGEATIGCRWSPPSRHPHFAAYELWRSHHSEGDAERMLVFRTEDRSHLRHLDGDVAAGEVYVYLLRVVDADGNVLGRSNPTRAMAGERPHERPRRVEDLRLACRAMADEDGTAVGCRWQASSHPDFATYELWRGQRADEGGHRTKVFETRDRAETFHVDKDLTAGDAYIYVVLVRDADGNVIGRGGPVRVVANDGPVIQDPAGRLGHGHGGRAG